MLADRQQLRQLFINLYNNAIDAIGENGGILTVRVIAVKQAPEKGVNGSRNVSAVQRDLLETPSTASPTACVVIEISDTGIGIPPENLQKIMEPFFTTKPEGQGTGLGLSICRRIAQEHHGALEITSKPGHGTTVRITLPAMNSEKCYFNVE